MAAIQLEPVIGDVAANLERSERLADAAAAAGAEWIVLPEFFTTGVSFREDLAGAALAPDGAATVLLRDLARRHGATVGGSFLCRDPDGEVRNAFLLSDPEGRIVGRHDKDLPTMWENCLYIGGEDDGILQAGDLRVGAAVCWEFMRTQTARRLRGQVDLVVGGSYWWSIPPWPPRTVFRRLEAANARTAALVAERFARFVGAPVVHAAHCGPLECRLPWTPITYRGIIEGGAVIADADGRVLARRDRREGAGFAIADVRPGRVPPADPLPSDYWLHRRGAIATMLWHYQREHGKRWYAKHTRGLPPLELAYPPREAGATGPAPARDAAVMD
jgi:predicted amidohydrolase